MKKTLFTLLASITFWGYAQKDTKVFEPTWTSLQRHETPQWLKDAKFGIYTHFSLETFRLIEGNESKHKHELIDDFKFENFNAKAWATLFKKTGAKFAGPVSWHGSGMVHWDSDVTKFDIVDMGPKKDITALLKKEINKQNMKFMMSFHTGYWYSAVLDQENPGRKNPKFYELYGTPHDEDVKDAIPWKNHVEKQTRYTEEHLDSWLKKMNEAVTKYTPDLSWVDVSFGGTVRAHNIKALLKGKTLTEELYLTGVNESRQKKYLAHYFNTAIKNNQEVGFVYKEYDVPPGIGMRNFENGLIDELTYDTWMTDIDMCQPVSWFYKEGMGIKDANLIIDILVDVTAKNGILLLNVPPKPDGTFADFITKELYEVGDWLQVNGEAIYETMPWSIYGEGPSALPNTGHYSEKKANASYTSKDFRFTQKDNTLYAICLGIPKGEITINSLGNYGRLYKDDILSITLLGSDAVLKYEQTRNNLKIEMPDNFKGKYACVFKIQRKP